MGSKTIRFDVFKRDGFACQYCGGKPPSIVLELDHITPKSKGGKDTTNNYITACFDCNRGKRDKLLTDLPTPIRNKLKILKEKRVQLQKYNEYLEKLEADTQKDIFRIESVFQIYNINRCFTDSFKEVTLKKFLLKLPLPKILEALKIACLRNGTTEDSILYFCGICWNWIKNPDSREW